MKGGIWSGPVDADGRSHGHSEFRYQKDDLPELEEGSMEAGVQEGPWVCKWRDGSWLLVDYQNDLPLSSKVNSADRFFLAADP